MEIAPGVDLERDVRGTIGYTTACGPRFERDGRSAVRSSADGPDVAGEGSTKGKTGMTDSRILLERNEAVATITLNRPDKLNAIDPQMLSELEVTIAQIEADQGIHVVMLTGAGERAFCVGADIHAWAALEPLDMWRVWIRDGHRVFNRLVQLRQPLIAVLNGYTFGGGLELALAADIRLAAEGVELALPEVTIGTIPGWGGTQRLPMLIGEGRARQMIFSGQRVSADIAARWGLVNEVLSEQALWARGNELANQIAQNAPIAVQLAKQVMNTDGTGIALEALAGALAATTQDGQEGIAAFRERRSAQFKGQ